MIFNAWAFYFIFSIIIGIALYEFYGLISKHKIETHKVTSIFIGLFIFTLFFLHASNVFDEIIFITIIPLIVILIILELYRKTAYPFHNIAYSILGLVWLILPFSLFNYLVFFDNIGLEKYTSVSLGEISNNFRYEILLGMFILLWSFDTFAYIVGVSIGKNRLFERISPKKSWEGFFGGLILSLGVAYILSMFFTVLSFQEWMILSIIVSVFGTFGDLTESMFKRSIGVKDSGKILPGHGGILDRFDGIFLAAPMVLFYIILITKF